MSSLDLLGAHLTSLDEVQGLCHEKIGDDGSGELKARRLNLHMNQIRGLAGLNRFRFLEELILSANCISELRASDFAPLASLRLLDLSCNTLLGIGGLQNLHCLQELRLAYNHIPTLEGLQQFWGRRYSLKMLDMRCNKVGDLRQLLFLGGCTKLETLAIQEGEADSANPICAEPHYRKCVVQAAPWLRMLDGSAVQEGEVKDDEGPRPSVPAARARDEPTEQERLPVLAEVFADQEVADREAAVAEAEATEAQRAFREALETRSQAMKEAEMEREARLHMDLEEIVMAVQKHEDHFAQQLERLNRAEGEQAAAGASQKEESAALAKEQEHLRELQRSEGSEAKLAADLKSEKDDAEKRLVKWEKEIFSPFASCANVAGLREELVGTSQRLKESRLRLASTEDRSTERLHAATSTLKCQEQLVQELRGELGRVESLQRAWAEEAAVATASVGEMRSVMSQQAQQDVEKLAAASALQQCLKESAANWTSEQELMQKEVDLLSVAGLSARAGFCDEEPGIGLIHEHHKLRQLVEETKRRSDDGSHATGMLKERLSAVLEQAMFEIEQCRGRLSTAEAALAQKGKVLKMAQEQEELDKYVLAEMDEQLKSAVEEATEAKLKAARISGLAEQEEIAALDGLAAASQVEQHIQELAQCTAASVPRAEFEEQCEAVKAVEGELQRLRGEDSTMQLQLHDLQAALAERREDLSRLLRQLQQRRDAREDTSQKLKIKLKMMADARSHMSALSASIQQADAAQHEDDVAWRDRLAKDAGAAEAYLKQADALCAAEAAEEAEVAKLSKLVQAKGERNGFADMQLQEVGKMTQEKASIFESKVRELENHSAHVLHEAKLAQNEMEERFRSERVEQQEEERRRRSQVCRIQQQLQESPLALQSLCQHIAQERQTSKLRLRSLLAGLSGTTS